MVKRNGDNVQVERSGSRTAGVVNCINALAQWKTFHGKVDNTDDFFFVTTKRK
jgi:hypothetical protein